MVMYLNPIVSDGLRLPVWTPVVSTSLCWLPRALIAVVCFTMTVLPSST